MRKVIFGKYIDVEWIKNDDSLNSSTTIKEGTGVHSEMVYEGVFHSWFDTPQNAIAIIECDGIIDLISIEHFKFIDTPEDEKRAEFAKAAMQGMLSNRLRENVTGWKLQDYVEESVKAADLLIDELNKPRQ
jgi:hypothetical protein